MKKILLIRPFGTSDCTYQGQRINDFRETTKQLAQNEDLDISTIRLGMLDEFLHSLMGNDPDAKYDIVGIFTNQHDPNPMDTIHLFDILKKYHKQHKTRKESPRSKVSIKIPMTLTNDPRKIDSVYNALVQEYDRIKTQIDLELYDRIIVNITSGTKGIVGGTTLFATHHFPTSKTDIVYMEQIENQSIPLYQHDILHAHHLSIITTMIDHYERSSLKEYLVKQGLQGEEKYAKYDNFAEYMLARLNGDYAKASVIYQYGRLPSSLALTPQYAHNHKIEELLNGLMYTWITDRLVEFLGRLYNFADVVTQEIAREVLAIDTTENMSYKKFKSLIAHNPDLITHLNTYKIINRDIKSAKLLERDHENSLHKNIQPDNFVNRYVFGAIVERAVKQDAYKKFEPIMTFITQTESINRYRNHTMIGHGTNPVTKTHIIEAYTKGGGSGDIENDIRMLMQHVFHKTSFWCEQKI